MAKYNIPIDNVIRHYDVTGKICPEPLVDEQAWANLKKKFTVGEESNKMTYNKIDDIPDWAKAAIQKLIKQGALKGDENGALGLSQDMLRILVILDRTGAFDN